MVWITETEHVHRITRRYFYTLALILSSSKCSLVIRKQDYSMHTFSSTDPSQLLSSSNQHRIMTKCFYALTIILFPSKCSLAIGKVHILSTTNHSQLLSNYSVSKSAEGFPSKK